jgi:predicted NAD/FAD-dependent oxidoreductase
MQGRELDGSKQCWTAVTTTSFAEQLLTDNPLLVDGKYNPQNAKYLESITPQLVQAFLAALDELGASNVHKPVWAASHRWGAGFVANPLDQGALTCLPDRIAACGDFCLGSSFENSVASGLTAADEVHSCFYNPRVSPSSSK